MVAREELIEGDEVVVALAHLLTGNGNHVVVHPIVHHGMSLRGLRLCDFALVVWEHQVHTSAVDVKFFTEIFAPHGCALAVPPWETIAPRRGPTHDVRRTGFFPKGKVHLVALFAHAIEFATRIADFFEVTSRKNTIFIVFVVLHHVEIDRTVAFISITCCENLFHQFDLFDDMSRSMRFDGRRKHIELCHSRIKTVGVELRHFHGFELIQSSFFRNFVLTLVGIMFQMPHIGDVADIAHGISQVFEVTEEEVEGNGRTRVSEVCITINGGSTYVHANAALVNGFEDFFCAREGVVNLKSHELNAYLMCQSKGTMRLHLCSVFRVL